MHPPSSPAPLSRRAMLKSAGGLGLFGALAAGLPALIPHVTDEKGTSSRDDLSLDFEMDRLENADADLVIIGDSMVPCRVDPVQLGEMLGKRVHLLYRHGSATAHWFLFFKNIVCAVANRPQRVVFFFRDTYWNLPRLRIGGERAGLIEDLSVGREIELESVFDGSAAKERPLVDRAIRVLDTSYEVDRYGEEARARIRKLALEATSIRSSGDDLMDRVDRLFALENLRHDLADDLADQGTESTSQLAGFDPSPTASFLPHIESLARQHGIDLGFHRVMRRRAAGPRYVPPPALRDYLQDMSAWAENNGHRLTDENGDPSLTASLFADGDHVKPEARGFWTTRIADHLRA